MNNRTFCQTFPCYSSMKPCYNKKMSTGYCPVNYDNFVANTSVPFFLEKKREEQSVLHCNDYNYNYCYYTNIHTPILQNLTYVHPYFIYPSTKSNKYVPKYIKEKRYSIIY